MLALVGAGAGDRWGRKLVRAHVLPPLRQSLVEHRRARPVAGRLAALFGGSVGVTLAYIAALACASPRSTADVSFAQVGAVYLGASLIAAAAPTPGGLGAMEAALVAGFTGVGMDPAIAVAAVLSYRLADVLAADPARLAVLPAASTAATTSELRRSRSLEDSLARSCRGCGLTPLGVRPRRLDLTVHARCGRGPKRSLKTCRGAPRVAPRGRH